ncbi:MAG: aminoacyl-tRNA hydrolase [Candidatus Schekmanbacteria bacterium]|nr:aminoacyl-tRNA hydrolase [Candidatus Schekmanbacteria bacterium]
MADENADREIVRDDELTIRASRSSGPGGQHANKTATRVEVVWNVHTAKGITDEERALILQSLASRVDKDGDLRVVSEGERSQLQNRLAAVARLRNLVAGALERPRDRFPTSIPEEIQATRLRRKHRRASVKRLRSATLGGDEAEE